MFIALVWFTTFFDDSVQHLSEPSARQNPGIQAVPVFLMSRETSRTQIPRARFISRTQHERES